MGATRELAFQLPQQLGPPPAFTRAEQDMALRPLLWSAQEVGERVSLLVEIAGLFPLVHNQQNSAFGNVVDRADQLLRLVVFQP